MLKTNFLRIRTARLELIAATLELAKLEMEAADDLARALECAMPESWPPPLNDEHSQRWYIEMLRHDPAAVGWGLWYLVRDQGSPSPELVGNAGFKGRPVNGICEIGYSLLPTHQGRGYATEAAQALVAWAFAHPEVNCVAAETLPELIGSIRVMEKCGMHFVAEGKPEDGQPTVRYQVAR
jgi:ribosomal-protein-alanine N-acetyltransferase